MALTRARERLYLASLVKDGRPQPGRGSLAEVMPPSLLDLFSQAAQTSGPGQVEWTGPSGAVHRFRCGAPPPAVSSTLPAPEAAPRPADFTRLTAAPVARAVTAADDDEVPPADARQAPSSDQQAGVLVHRLMERFGGRPVEAEAVLPRLAELVGPDLLPGDGPGREALVARAVAAHRALLAQPELAALLASGEVHHEVPFSVRSEGLLCRGVLDCLVRTPEGAVTVLEFKTGKPRPEHQQQIATYRMAAEKLFPGANVDVRLFFSSLPSPDPSHMIERKELK